MNNSVENFTRVLTHHNSCLSPLYCYHFQQEVYMTSTKKQKMLISRSVVKHVCTQLLPPGRFLEKNADTGLYHEVDTKRALEKTAQALRDGASTSEEAGKRFGKFVQQ